MVAIQAERPVERKQAISAGNVSASEFRTKKPTISKSYQIILLHDEQITREGAN